MPRTLIWPGVGRLRVKHACLETMYDWETLARPAWRCGGMFWQTGRAAKLGFTRRDIIAGRPRPGPHSAALTCTRTPAKLCGKADGGVWCGCVANGAP